MESKYISNLAFKIVCYRLDNNLTQSEFAKLCKLSAQTISNLENDRATPTVKTLISLKRLIGE